MSAHGPLNLAHRYPKDWMLHCPGVKKKVVANQLTPALSRTTTDSRLELTGISLDPIVLEAHFSPSSLGTEGDVFIVVGRGLRSAGTSTHAAHAILSTRPAHTSSAHVQRNHRPTGNGVAAVSPSSVTKLTLGCYQLRGSGSAYLDLE